MGYRPIRPPSNPRDQRRLVFPLPPNVPLAVWVAAVNEVMLHTPDPGLWDLPPRIGPPRNTADVQRY